MGAAVRRIQEASGIPSGGSWKGQKRNNCYKQDYPTIEPCSRRSYCTCTSSSDAGGCRDPRRGCGQGGGIYALQAPDCVSKLRQLFRTGTRCIQGSRNYRRWRADGRAGEGQATQKAAINGALWRWQITCYMNDGRELGVLCNPIHEAQKCLVLDFNSDAYQLPTRSSGAACGERDAYFQLFTAMKHSIQTDPLCIDPFRALLRASCLQWEVMKDLYNCPCGTLIMQLSLSSLLANHLREPILDIARNCVFGLRITLMFIWVWRIV